MAASHPSRGVGNLSSLLAGLPYEPSDYENICEICTIVFTLWYSKYERTTMQTSSQGRFRLNMWGDSVPEERFINVIQIGRQWVQTGYALKSSAQHCRSCCFIIETLDSCPWLPYQDNDYLQLKPVLVGSIFRGHTRRSSEHESYTRLRLQLFRNNGDHTYTASDFTYILPLDKPENNGVVQSQNFHGRVVNAEVSYDLVQKWFNTCKTRHTKQPTKLSEITATHKQVNNGSDGCCPDTKPLILNFRLLDVYRRCVVLASTNDLYAALSYVWGNAKRLLLCNENLAKLSKPGALSHSSDELPCTFRDALFVAERLGIPYLWIDALCVLQDNEEQLVQQMNMMDSIYSCAVLTIVSDTENADSGIPGVSISRGFPQATFQHGSQSFISSKQTFGNAMSNSPWESRGWCLQEKVFSKRLLIFTLSQAFFHCVCSTWSEDTILNLEGDESAQIELSEARRPNIVRRGKPTSAAYDAHQPLYGNQFWALVRLYSQKQLSFDSDAIRAFSGILKSVELEQGSHIWGIPRAELARGLTFSFSEHKTNLRRFAFPSWTWAGWKGNTGAVLNFHGVLRNDGERDIWALDWHYYRLAENGEYELIPVHLQDIPRTSDSLIKNHESNTPIAERRVSSELISAADNIPTNPFGWTSPAKFLSKNPAPVTNKSFDPTTWNSLLEVNSAPTPKHILDAIRITASTDATSASDPPGAIRAQDWVTQTPNLTATHSPAPMKTLSRSSNLADLDPNLWDRGLVWNIPDHPGTPSYIPRRPVPPLAHDPETMPPLSHILRFWTSSAMLYIDADIEDQKGYSIRLPHTGQVLGHVSLDPKWGGLGKLCEFIYISTGQPGNSHVFSEAGGICLQLLNLMLIEWDEADVVASRVTMCSSMSICDWRLAETTWKCIALA